MGKRQLKDAGLKKMAELIVKASQKETQKWPIDCSGFIYQPKRPKNRNK